MRLTEIDFTGPALPIDGYGPGFFRIGGEVVTGACAVLPGGVTLWGGYADRAALIEGAAGLDVLFVGTGAETLPLPKDFVAEMEAAGLAVEPMASPAAARTYNVLLSEGRRVGVALLPV